MAIRAQTLYIQRWVALSRPHLEENVYLTVKRCVDVLLSSLLLVLLAPLFLLVGLAIVLDSSGPVLFIQERVRGGRLMSRDRSERDVFRFLKFRTMYHGTDQGLHRAYVSRLIAGGGVCQRGPTGLYKLEDDPRVTRVGRFLRRSSLDELPQLANILVGQMSFIGPRPALPYEVAQYEAHHRRRLSVRQGLTGLWQVMGRSQLSFEDMCELDSQYVTHRCLSLDLRILLATIPAVLGRRGVC